MASSWERLATVTLGSAGDTLTSGTFTAKKHLKFEYMLIRDSNDINDNIHFNDVTGDTNYSMRRSFNNGDESGSFDGDNPSNGNGFYYGTVDSSPLIYASATVINIADEEKLGILHGVASGTAGAGNAPSLRRENAFKWSNTSVQITKITLTNNIAGSYGSGSTLTVWGADDQGSTAKDKSSITDVPVGTRYEETDTRKIYRWVEGAVAEAKTNVFQGSNSDASNNENYGNSLYVLDTANAGKKISKIGLKIKPQSGSGTGAGNIKCALFDLGSTSGNSRRPTNKLGGKQSAVSGSADPTASYSATLDGYTYATFLENSQPTIPADGKFFLFYVPDRTLTHYTTSTTSSASESIHHSPDYSEDGGANFSYSVDPIPTPFTTDHYGAGGSLGSVMAYTVVEDTWVEKGTAS